jgi:hypothetical protein
MQVVKDIGPLVFENEAVTTVSEMPIELGRHSMITLCRYANR